MQRLIIYNHFRLESGLVAIKANGNFAVDISEELNMQKLNKPSK